MLDMAGFAEAGVPVLADPGTRRWDQFMDLRSAGASKFLVGKAATRLSLSDRLRLFDVSPPSASTTTDAGYLFGPTIPSGSVTEVTGQVLTYGINVPQVGARDTAVAGGIFRIDVRASEKKASFNAYAAGSSTFVERMSIMLDTGLVGIGLAGVTPGAQLHDKIVAAGNVGEIIQGFTSQTADLTQWQNSSATVLSKVDKDGYLTLPGGLRFIGFTTSAGGASTTEYPNNKDCGIHINTTLASVRVCFNNAGTMVSALLT